MQTLTLARNAMATRFEMVLHGEGAASLHAAGEEALEEVARLEDQLSLYRPGSQIAQVNSRAAYEPVRITPEVFALLEHAQRLHAETKGAFDITIAPLVRCWGFMGGTGQLPTDEEVAAAREKVGMQHVQLDAAERTVRFDRDGVMLDLGAIGKGYAVERAAETLRETGITSGLLHGGTSTVYAIGAPPDAEAWKVAIERPPLATRISGFPALAPVPLKDEAMSVSAIWGRFFESNEKNFGHVLDARTGRPTEAALLSVAVLPSATETDALSTALLTVGKAGINGIVNLRPGFKGLVVGKSGSVARWPSDGP